MDSLINFLQASVSAFFHAPLVVRLLLYVPLIAWLSAVARVKQKPIELVDGIVVAFKTTINPWVVSVYLAILLSAISAGGSFLIAAVTAWLSRLPLGGPLFILSGAFALFGAHNLLLNVAHKLAPNDFHSLTPNRLALRAVLLTIVNVLLLLVPYAISSSRRLP